MTFTENETNEQTKTDFQGRHWYAVRVRSNFEMVTSLILRGKGIDGFCPTYTTLRRWSDRLKEVSRPLFPGYVFCRIPLLERVSVLSTLGVVGIVGTGRTDVPIPQHEIDAVRLIMTSRLETKPWPYVEAGNRVLVESGPLAGTEGIVLEVKDQLRLVVSIDILQRAVATEIERSWIRPLHCSRLSAAASA
jgi:transcription antitermination factor NusG